MDVTSTKRQTTLPSELLTTAPTARSWAASDGADSRHDDSRRQQPGHPGDAGDDRLRRRRRPWWRGAAHGGRHLHRLDDRRRRLDRVHLRYLQRRGGGDHQLRRPGRERGQRSVAERRPEDRRATRSEGRRTCRAFRAAGSAATTARSCRAAGLRTPGALIKQWDFDTGFGGPIKRDALWYFVTARDEGQHRTIPGIFPNLNAGDPTKFLYVPDTTQEDARRGELAGRQHPPDVAGHAAQQVQLLLERADPVQRRRLHQRRRRVPQTAGHRARSSGRWASAG